MKERLVGGQGFAIDASLIHCPAGDLRGKSAERGADVQKQNSSNPEDWAARVAGIDDAPCAVQEYLETLDDEAFGAATTTKPKFTAHADPASRSNRTAEIGAMRKMIDRTEQRFGLKPDWIAADTAYGSSDNLVWRALKRKILPFIPVFTARQGIA